MASVIYCSPSQSNDRFDTFLSNFQKPLNDINNRTPSLQWLQVTLIQDVPAGGLMISLLQKG